MSAFEVHSGDALDVLRTMPDDSVDSVVTDPPSGTGFLGEEWDQDKGGRDEWIEWLRRIQVETLRVLKPGGHQLAWALPRTSHWTGMALELAGWDVRDMIHHLFGTGFPKNHRIDAAIDKIREDNFEDVRAFLLEHRDRAGFTNRQIDDAFGFNGMACHWISSTTQPSLPTVPQWRELVRLLKIPDGPGLDAMTYTVEVLNERKGEFGEDWKARPITGTVEAWAPTTSYAITSADGLERAEAVSDRSKPWVGWGTALKPGHEVWWLARNGLEEKSIARQVLACGTGALNLGACEYGQDGKHPPNMVLSHSPACDLIACATGCPVFALGRDRAHAFPVFRYCPKPTRREKDRGLEALAAKVLHRVNSGGLENDPRWAPVTVKNDHPTVKPVDLMRWFVRLVTPPGGIVLDPFTGSGTTGVAALEEGARFIGIEKREAAAELARARLEYHALEREERAARDARNTHIEGQGLLFGGSGEGT